MFLNKIHNLVNLCLVALKLLVEFFVNSGIDRKKSLVTNEFVVCIKSFLDIFDAELFDLSHNLWVGI